MTTKPSLAERTVAAETSTAIVQIVSADINFTPEQSQRMLAGRLASVAQLNTKAGRKPHRAVPLMPTNAPARPTARVGAKKQRAMPNGTRVLIPQMRTRSSAQIIPFPSGAALVIAKADVQAKAA